MKYPYVKYSNEIESYLSNILIDLDPVDYPAKPKLILKYELILFTLAITLIIYYFDLNYYYYILVFLLVLYALYINIKILTTFKIDYFRYLKIKNKVRIGNIAKRFKISDLKDENKFELYKNDKILSHSKNYTKPILMNSDAKKGYSESFFLYYLNHYFGSDIKLLRTIRSNDLSIYNYTPDFVFQNSDICIDIEIDEPYTLFDKKATHSIDDNYDRDGFFTNNNWTVIRFSEDQILMYPIECCKYIAEIIYKITFNRVYFDKLKFVEKLEITNRWTIDESNELIKLGHREKMILKANSNASNIELFAKNYFENVSEYIITKIGDYLSDYHHFYNCSYYGPKKIIMNKIFLPDFINGDSLKISLSNYRLEVFRKSNNFDDENLYQEEIIIMIPLK